MSIIDVMNIKVRKKMNDIMNLPNFKLLQLPNLGFNCVKKKIWDFFYLKTKPKVKHMKSS
jgi:hypothetical protein